VSAQDSRPLRVLLVDDDPDDARTSLALLAAAGADVSHVGSAEDALSLLDQGPAVDVVLLDLGLPGLSGVDAVRAVRERATPEVPVVVLTANDDADLALLAIATGAQDVLVKRATDASLLARTIAFAQQRQGSVCHVDLDRATAVRANLAKTEFLASVSHEIRTPLNTVLGMAELLAETGLSYKQERLVETLRRAGDHLLQLVDEMLDLARIEAGRLTLEKRPFDLGRLVDSAIDFLRPAAQRKGVELRVDWDPDLCKVVVGDARRLRQILVNLIANGVKFTDTGFVRVVVASDPANHARGALQFLVEDTGIGIGHDNIEAIFGSFVQGDPSIARRYGGTGLGLNIVWRLVDLMGGWIWVESAPGRGCRFHVTLVLEPSEERASRPSLLPDTPKIPESSTGELAGLRVLMVDDSDESRALIAAYLAPSGAKLEVADDARSALERLARETFDVVLMDLHLPGMDGFAATRALRRAEAERGARSVPVVALSADALPETVKMALACGCSEHLAKPIRKAALLATLRRHAAQGANRDPQPPAWPARSQTAAALLPKFLGHRERDVGTLHEALARLDFDPIATIAHNMRGNGVSYGFPEISQIGFRLEEAARAKNVPSVEEEIAHLQACIVRIRAEAGLSASPEPRPSSSMRVRAVGSPTPGRKTGET
jgi:signal transduction histidine kinase/HPt (histidine-containing phosphotransfer) domain-containing protein